jgi:hypothetical protein
MSPVVRFFRHPLSVHLALWGPVNPFSLFAAFVVAPSSEPSTNVTRFDPASFLPLSMLLLWPVAALCTYGVFRAFRRRAPLTRVALAFHLSQVPFAPFLLLAGLAFDGLEGNIVGFIVVPAAIVGLIVTAPISLAILIGATVHAARRADAQARASQTADASSSQPSAE